MLGRFLNRKADILPSSEGYQEWAASYDDQPDNPTLLLEQRVFDHLASACEWNGKRILDYGCGTGRHWRFLLDHAPASLEGLDVSDAMLEKLRQKFPGASVTVIEDPSAHTPSLPYDVLISTLVMGHVKNPAPLIEAWSRWLVPGGTLLLTMLHPAWEQWGLERTYESGGETKRLEHYFHPLDRLVTLFNTAGFLLEQEHTAHLDASIEHHYERLGRRDLYEETKGRPLIWGARFRLQSSSGT